MQHIGRYEILEEIGRGATGVVYRARDPSIGRLLAIKTITLSSPADPQEASRLRERLRREAHSAGILSHPGIVVVYDVGQERELAYIAMELVPGRSLQTLLASGQPLDKKLVVSVLRQAAAALDYAHKKGVVHRDVKPANILISEEGVAKITDFGVAKLSSAEQLTITGTVLGTPSYMSPEQIQGKPVDGRADQFALAVIAYEVLTGEKPFAGESLTTILYKIVTEQPRPAHHVNPRLPWAVSVVLERALAKKPEERYPSCGEFVAALENALETEPGWQPGRPGAAEAVPSLTAGETVGSRAVDTREALAGPAGEKAAVPLRGSARRLRVGVLAAALGALAVGAVIFLGLEKWRRPTIEQLRVPTGPTPSQAKPSPMPPPAVVQPTPEAVAPEREPELAEPEQTAPQPAREAPGPAREAPQPESESRAQKAPPVRKPGQAEHYKLMVATSPPGAEVIFDRDPQSRCITPCTVVLAEGRHTLVASLPGYRREMRLVELTGPREIFIAMAQPRGAVRVESVPPGAQIIVDGNPRPETTPATFVVPVGKCRIEVVRNGERAQREIEVKEGALVRVFFQLER